MSGVEEKRTGDVSIPLSQKRQFAGFVVDLVGGVHSALWEFFGTQFT